MKDEEQMQKDFESWWASLPPVVARITDRAAAWVAWDQASSLQEERLSRMREALNELLTRCEISDDARYGTLSTTFIKQIARKALEE